MTTFNKLSPTINAAGYSGKEILSMFLLFFSLFGIYTYLTFFTLGDMKVHALFAKLMSEGSMPYPGNFIFYGLANIVSFVLALITSVIIVLKNITIAKISVSFLMACATVYKFYWTYKDMATACESKKLRWGISLSLLLIVAIPLPSLFVTGNWFLGNFMSNTWHNSTTVFLFPFAILLFAASIKQLISFNNRLNLWLLLFVCLNIFIKPSYFFVWICVYPIFLLIKYGISSTFWKGLIPAIIGSLLLLFQYILIYHSAHGFGEESSIIVKPFSGYTLFSPLHILPLSLLFSMLFPITYLIVNVKRIYNNNVFLFTYATFFMSIVIYLLLMETGLRATHGNFYWQIVICSWFCFYISLKDWWKNYRKTKKSTWITTMLVIIYCGHILCGLTYLFRYLILETYS
jgi:hypothetical protein